MTKVILLIILLTVNSCTTNLEKLLQRENELKSDDFYSSYLALEYLKYSTALKDGKDKKNSEYFATKGLRAADGLEVELENPTLWNLDFQEAEDAISSQIRLKKVLNYEVKKILPIQMAHLSFLYDCWISKEAKALYRLGEVSRCKVRFYEILTETEAYIESLQKEIHPDIAMIDVQFEHFQILFDLDKYNFNDAANKRMLEVLDYLKSLNGDYRILLIGNADRLGNELYNQNLALRRMLVVKNYLLQNGVPADLVETRSLGEDFPDIITKRGVQQQLNRTASIYVLKGAKNSFEDYSLPLIENHVYKKEVTKARKARGL